MTPRKPASHRRLAAVMSATLAAIITTALIAGPDHPFPALLIIAGILAASSAVLPSPAWSWWFRLAGRMIPRRVKYAARFTVSVILGQPRGGRPRGPVKARLREWHERLYFHLTRAEWDARVQIGMSLWHSERLAYHVPNPEQWDELEDSIWPGSEWAAVIEQFWRDSERRPGQ